jgi:hypothetical protein
VALSKALLRASLQPAVIFTGPVNWALGLGPGSAGQAGEPFRRVPAAVRAPCREGDGDDQPGMTAAAQAVVTRLVIRS